MSGKIKLSILHHISNFANQNPEQEICGVIVSVDGEKKFIECENIAKDKKNFFVIDGRVYLDHNIEMVVHSHCIGSADPSSTDLKCADSLNVPFLIYSIIDNNFCLYENKSVLKFKV